MRQTWSVIGEKPEIFKAFSKFGFQVNEIDQPNDANI